MFPVQVEKFLESGLSRLFALLSLRSPLVLAFRGSIHTSVVLSLSQEICVRGNSKMPPSTSRGLDFLSDISSPMSGVLLFFLYRSRKYSRTWVERGMEGKRRYREGGQRKQ